jgi:hypothetical protein
MGTFFSAQSGPITSGSTWKLADSKSFSNTTATTIDNLTNTADGLYLVFYPQTVTISNIANINEMPFSSINNINAVNISQIVSKNGIAL